MGNAPMNTEFLDKALKFAIEAHKNTERRGKGFPYVVHVMEAVAIVATMTKDQEILAAAALHDVIEDTDYTLDDIKKEFGEKVASYVNSETDIVIEGPEEETWVERKKYAIEHLKKASIEAKMVAMGDKLSNMRAIYYDYHVKGDKLWDIFHVKDKALHKWHYEGLRDSFYDLKDTESYKEFSRMIDEIFSNN